MESKPVYLSKTLWVNTLVALAGILASFGVLPSVKSFLDSNSEIVLMVLGGVGIGLRMITKGKVELW